MSSTTRNRTNTKPAQRAQSSQPSDSTNRTGGPARWWWIVAAVIVAIGVGASVYAVNQGNAGAPEGGAAPYVGGDLHVLAAIEDRLYVGGHDGAAASDDDGRTWTAIDSLRGADPMGWAVTSDAMLVGGHPGLFRSTDDGATFTMVSGDAAIPDVHALGGSGDVAYAASPTAGFLASEDGGATWQARNTEVGQGFMGTILVDPENPQRLVAPDMASGLVTSSDGGATWTVLGGPGGTMSAAWDPTDTARLVSIGMGDSAISTNGGATWTPIEVPAGTSVAAFSADGETLYTGALLGTNAAISVSTDDGKTWTPMG